MLVTTASGVEAASTMRGREPGEWMTLPLVEAGSCAERWRAAQLSDRRRAPNRMTQSATSPATKSAIGTIGKPSGPFSE